MLKFSQDIYLRV